MRAAEWVSMASLGSTIASRTIRLRVKSAVLPVRLPLRIYPDRRTSSGRPGMSQTVESRMGAVAWAMRQRSVSHPRSSNRTCPIKASGSPTGFTVRHTAGPLGVGVRDAADCAVHRQRRERTCWSCIDDPETPCHLFPKHDRDETPDRALSWRGPGAAGCGRWRYSHGLRPAVQFPAATPCR